MKTIRKLACEEFLAAKYAMRIALKPSKGFCMFLFILIGHYCVFFINNTHNNHDLFLLYKQNYSAKILFFFRIRKYKTKILIQSCYFLT